MKKILIAVSSDFLRDTYAEVFKNEGFEVASFKTGNEAFQKAESEKFDLIIADISPEINGFKILEDLNRSGKKMATILLGQYEDKENRKKAMDLEARDFIVYSSVTPAEVIRKIKIVLGEQKSYRVKVADINNIKGLLGDLGYDSHFTCPKCQSELEMNLTRDLASGSRHFLVSFVCPNNCE